MSKKPRGKSPTGSVTGSKWDANITTATLNEESWSASTTLIIPNQIEDAEIIKSLGIGVASGQRRLFSFLSKEDLDSKIIELGNPKVKKGKDVPANYEICEAAKPYVDANEEIPLPLLAKLIKFSLLTIKADALKKQDADKKTKSEATTKGKGKADKAGGKERQKSAGKKGGAAAGKKSPEPPSVKGETKLRKRGEEDPDAKYIDDEPDVGASRYIILTGFDHPQLLPFLAEIGAIPDSIVRVRTQDYDVLRSSATAQISPSTGEKTSVPIPDLAAEEERRMKEAESRKRLARFWRDVNPVLRGNSSLRNIAMLDFEVKALVIPDNINDPEKRLKFGMALFDDISSLMYDLLDFRRQWLNYLKNLHLLPVPGSDPSSVTTAAATSGLPGVGSPAADGGAGAVAREDDGAALKVAMSSSDPKLTEVDLRYYNDLMDAVPMECASVELVLNAVLEQVEATSQGKPPPSLVPERKRPDGVDPKVARHLRNISLKMALKDDEIKLIESEFPRDPAPPAPPTHPERVHWLDQITQRAKYLPPIGVTPGLGTTPDNAIRPLDAEFVMLHRVRPFTDLVGQLGAESSLSRERAARLQQLLFFVSRAGLRQEEVDHAFKLFAFECMELTRTDVNGIIVQNQWEGLEPHPIPWDDPYPYFAGLSDLVHMEEKQAQVGTQVAGGTGTQQGDSPGVSARGTDRDATVSPRPTSAGILRRSRSASPTQSGPGTLNGLRRSSTVHFDPSAVEKSLRDEFYPDMEHGVAAGNPDLPSSNEEAVSMVDAAQKRQLDEWCFAEHLEPNVLLQVLRDAAHTLPYLDTYYHKRDHSLLLVLHNPFQPDVLSNHRRWQHWLHANVGFRNYLDLVAEGIADWTREQEAIYQAQLLSAEVEKTNQEDDAAAKKVDETAKKAAGAKGKGGAGAKRGKSRSRSQSGSRASTPEAGLDTGENQFILAGSLKAMKLEQERIKREKDEEERKKQDKRTKSAQKREKDAAAAAAEKGKEKRPGSRTSSKSRTKAASRSGSADAEQAGNGEATEGGQKVEGAGSETYWPFTGYDLGDNLVHVAGETTHMFPTDGTIRSERADFVQGSTTIRTSVLKDGHVLTIHITDPVTEITECQEATPADPPQVQEQTSDLSRTVESGAVVQQAPISTDQSLQSATARQPAAISFFNSFTATLSDGICMSLSRHGPSGQPAGLRRPGPEPYLPPARSASVASIAQDEDKPGGTKGIKKGMGKGPEAAIATARRDSGETEQQPAAVTTGRCDLNETETARQEDGVGQPYHQLNLTLPDGQRVVYMLEHQAGIPIGDTANFTSDRRLILQMSRPWSNVAGKAHHGKSPFNEVKRFVTSDGVVIKILKNGATVVLYPDGSVAECQPAAAGFSGSATAPGPTAGGAMRDSPRSQQLQQQTRVKSQQKSEETAKKAGKSGIRGRGSVTERGDSQQQSDALDDQPTDNATQWRITLPSGDRYWRSVVKATGNLSDRSSAAADDKATTEGEDSSSKVTQDTPLTVTMATDPGTGQVMYSREDRVVMVRSADYDEFVAEHADGTRMTQFVLYQVLSNPSEDQQPGSSDDQMEPHHFVRLECPGYSHVLINRTTGEMEMRLGGGSNPTMLLSNPMGHHAMQHGGGGQLSIQPDGTVLYTGRHLRETAYLQPTGPSTYILRQYGPLVCEVVDTEGNMFTVDPSGNCQVLLAGQSGEEEGGEAGAALASWGTAEEQPTLISASAEGNEAKLEGAEEELPEDPLVLVEDDQRGAADQAGRPQSPAEPIRSSTSSATGSSAEGKNSHVQQYGEHAPRLFILRPDGSGTELVRYRTVAEFLAEAEQQPGTATVKEELQDCPGVLGITVLHPIMNHPTDSWTSPYVQETIVPAGLTSRDLKTLPAREMKTLGPKFGTNAGRSLAIGALAGSGTSVGLGQQSQLRSKEQRKTEQGKRGLPAGKCPRRLEVRQFVQFNPTTRELRNKFKFHLRQYAEHVQTRLAQQQALDLIDPRSAEERYLAAQCLAESNVARAAFPLGGSIESLYSTATGPPPPAKPATPKAKRTAADLERDRRELEDEKMNKEALKHKIIPNYFSSKGGKDFLLSQATDIYGLAKKLDIFPSTEPSTPMQSLNPDTASEQQLPTGDNNTPGDGLQEQTSAVGEQLAAPASRKFTYQLETSKSAGATTKKSSGFPYYDTLITADAAARTGLPKRPSGGPPLPSYLFAGRPNVAPNLTQARLEDPVRRRVLTTALIGGPLASQLALRKTRGIDLLPQRLDFGLLREGYTYRGRVCLRNSGPEPCRFKVKAPPPATGIRLVYQPGSVPAGLSRDLYIDLYAIAVGVEGGSGVGTIAHDLDITTETDHIRLPITGRVMTAASYDAAAAGATGTEASKLGPAAGIELVDREGHGPAAGTRLRRSQEVSVA